MTVKVSMGVNSPETDSRASTLSAGDQSVFIAIEVYNFPSSAMILSGKPLIKIVSSICQVFKSSESMPGKYQQVM